MDILSPIPFIHRPLQIAELKPCILQCFENIVKMSIDK